MGFLEERLDLGGGGVLFLRVVESRDGAGEVIGVNLARRFGDEGGEGVRVESEGFGAVWECFLGVVHLFRS